MAKKLVFHRKGVKEKLLQFGVLVFLRRLISELRKADFYILQVIFHRRGAKKILIKFQHFGGVFF